MWSNFLQKNKSTLLIIGVLLTLFLLLRLINDDQTEALFNHPKTGQIYIFYEDNRYAPMRLDSLDHDQYYFRNYLFVFADALPREDQILAEEFDLNFMAIYDRQELKRLFESGKLIKIYAP